MKLYYAVIDKKSDAKCSGLGIYFAYAENESEARKIFQTRCSSEHDYNPYVFWKISEIHEVDPNLPIKDFINDKYILLRC